MKNRLTDLNNHLFAQMERLLDEDLTEEQIELEAKRAEAVVNVSDQILRTADTALKGAKLIAEHGAHFRKDLPMLSSPQGGAEE